MGQAHPGRANGVEVVFNGVGGPVAAEAFELLGPGGRMLSYGMASGSFAQIPGDVAAARGVTLIRGVPVSPAEAAGLTPAALTEAAAGRLRPVIGQRFSPPTPRPRMRDRVPIDHRQDPAGGDPMSDIAQQAAPGAEAAPYRWRRAAFAVVLAGSVMDLLDSLAANVASLSIRADIGGGPTLLQWLLAGYTLAMAIGLITGGRLGDLCGRRPVLLAGIAGFTIGSILCSIATQPGELIAFRVVQGLFEVRYRNTAETGRATTRTAFGQGVSGGAGRGRCRPSAWRRRPGWA